MNNTQKQLKFWRTESEQFEAIVKGWREFDRNLVDALCNMRLNQFGLEYDEITTLDTKIKMLRRLFAAKIKYWKTIVRYPVKKGEILILGYHPTLKGTAHCQDTYLKTYGKKFPFKVKYRTDDRLIFHGFPNYKPRHFKLGAFTLSCHDFLTGDAETNKITNVFKTPSTC